MQEKGIPERRTAFLETCFDTFCENGLENTSLKMLADACGVTNGNLLYYFGSKDNTVIESTAHCMAKVVDDFMARAPTSFADIERFLREMPYVTAKLHGAKYLFMYQVYASPKYRELSLIHISPFPFILPWQIPLPAGSGHKSSRFLFYHQPHGAQYRSETLPLVKGSCPLVS